MPSNPAGNQPPLFTAPPVASTDDCTVFIHRPAVQGEVPREEPTSDFNPLSKYLLSPGEGNRCDGAGGSPPGGGHSPRLSEAAEASFYQASTEHKHRARGLFCFAARQESVSVTLRGIDPDDVAHDPAHPPGWFRREWLKSSFDPPRSRFDGKKTHFWFSLAEQCETLWNTFMVSGHGHPHGLVVLTGSTNSAKSEIARGLVHLRLEDARAAAARTAARRPHLVTFEDPIEKLYVRPAKPDRLTWPAAAGRAIGAGLGMTLPELPVPAPGGGPFGWTGRFERAAVSARLAQFPAAQLAYWYGVDYTPREKGKDVRDLRQAFADALRQTPTAFFIGEVRDPKDWADVLEFAGTGHLVVTTAHAGSLLEALMKILSAVGAKTPAARRLWASKILAVVHLRAEELRLAPYRWAVPRRLLLPTVWRRTAAGLAGISASGFGAVVPTYLHAPVRGPGGGNAPARNTLDEKVSSLGRRYFVDQLIAAAVAPGAHESGAEFRAEIAARTPALQTTATRLDLQGE